MINHQYSDINLFEELFQDYSKRINRLKSTLQGRLNLINKFKGLIDKNYIPITFKNIEINTNNEQEIIDFLSENTNYIHSYLINRVNSYFEIKGSK